MTSSILIVEDYDDARDYMVIILQSYDFQVYQAANGCEALKAVIECHPDLILMDISMPVMDGLEATRAIRKLSSEFSRIPIIALTAFDKSYHLKAMDAGCNGVIGKPVNFDELDQVIKKHIRFS